MIKKLPLYRPYIILILLIFLIGFISIVYRNISDRIVINDPQPLNESWTLNQSTINLPSDQNTPKDIPITISKTLPNDFSRARIILVRTSLQDVTVMLDDQIIYERNYDVSGQFPPYASMWHFVETPGHSEGKTLTITLSSPYEAMSGVINEISYGTQAELIWSIAKTYGFRLFIGLFVMALGLIMVTISLFVYKTQFKGNVYLGIFALILSLWIIAESRMIQFFTGSQMVIGSLAYIMLAIIPIPLIIYVRDYLFIHGKKRYTIFMGIVMFNALLVFILHAFSILDFFESVIITQAIIVAGFIMTIITTIQEIKVYKNPYAKTFLRVFVVLIFFGMLEFINFLTNNFKLTSIYALIGIGLISVIVMINYLKYLIERLKLSYKTEIFEKLAYTDQLTSGQNRMAFERDIEKAFNHLQTREGMTLILFDLDDLKNVNDMYGHLEGDHAIQVGFECIIETFGKLGLCYRIGGDEFACIALETNKEMFLSYEKTFYENLKRLTASMRYHFRISIGHATYDINDLKPSDLIKRADDAMYLNKCTYKDNCERIKR